MGADTVAPVDDSFSAEFAEAHAELDRHGAPPGPRLADRIRALVQGERALLPKDRDGRSIHFSVLAAEGEVDGYVTANLMPGGAFLREAFVRLAKPTGASEIEAQRFIERAALLDAVAMCMSKGLAAGVPLRWFVSMFRHTRFEPSGATNLRREDGVPFQASSLLDLLGFVLERHVPKDES